MQLNIRWKLILSLGLPLLAVYFGMLAWDYTRGTDAAIDAAKERIGERANIVSAQLDSRLHSLAQLAESGAAALAARTSTSEPQLRGTVLAGIRQDAVICSAAVVLEPGGNGPSNNSNPAAPAVAIAPGAAAPASTVKHISFMARKQGGTLRVSSAPEAMNPDSLSWYTQAKQSHKAAWSDAYVDPAFGPGRLYTVAAPIMGGDDTFRGVVALTLRAEDAVRLLGPPSRPLAPPPAQATDAPPAGPIRRNPGSRRDQRNDPRGPLGQPPPPASPPSVLPAQPGAVAVDTEAAPEPAGPAGIALASLGPDGFVIIDRQWQVVAHSNSGVTDSNSVFLLARQRGLADLASAGETILGGEEGVLRVQGLGAVSPAYGEHDGYWMAYSPIAATGWTFTTAIPESTIMDPILKRLAEHAVVLTAGLVGAMVVLSLVSIRISRPIESLALAVDRLARGDLDVQVNQPAGFDETARLSAGFNSMVRQLRAHVDALTRESATREKIESELRIGRQIQSELLPGRWPPFPDHHEFDLHGVNVPALHVAGDFFDFFFTPDGRLCFVIADVAGKGVPAALLMAVTRTLVRNLAMQGLPPREVALRTNIALLEDSPKGLFVTLFLGQYSPSTGELNYVNAGHPSPVRLSGNGHERIEARELGDSTAPLLGVFAEMDACEFTEGRTQLRRGETLLLFTDGVTEATSPEGRMIGTRGLGVILEKLGARSARDLCETVVAGVRKFQGSNTGDDITVLALRRN